MTARRFRFPCLAAATGLAIALGYCPSVGAQTVDQELRDLVNSHPLIRAGEKNVAAAEEAIRAARSGYLPTLKLSGDTGPEYVDSPTRRQTEGRRFYKGRETSGATLTQKLFDGFSTDSQVEGAKAQKGATEADTRSTRQTTILEGVTAYTNVLRQSKLIQLARENERKVQEQLNLEDERVQKGAGMAADVLAAKQRLQVAKERRVNYEGEFDTAVSKYTQVFGHAPDIARLSDPPVPADLIPPKLEEAISSAEQENPKIERDAQRILVNDERRRTAEAGYYPTIDLVGKANYENDKNATIGVRRDWSLLLTANWELFSGFKTDALVAQASLEHASSKDVQMDTSRKVTEAVKISWYQLRTARERMGLLENAANIAEEVWAAQKKRREAGKATVQDVLDEETRINDARINYTSAYYDMIRYSYELLAAMGRLEVESIERAPANRTELKPAVVAGQPLTQPRKETVLPMSAVAPVTPEPPPPAPAPQPAVRSEPLAPAPVQPALKPISAPADDLAIPDGSPSATHDHVKRLMNQSGL